MVGAITNVRLALTPCRNRAKPDADTRRSRHGTHHPDKSDRPVNAALPLEAWAEIERLNDIALIVHLPRAQDRRVADIFLGDAGRALQLYGPITARLRIGIVVVAQKRGKNGFAINAGQASLDHPALPIDKGGGLAIADGPEIKRSFIHLSPF